MLTGWLAEWLAGCQSGWLACRAANWPVNWLAGGMFVPTRCPVGCHPVAPKDQVALPGDGTIIHPLRQPPICGQPCLAPMALPGSCRHHFPPGILLTDCVDFQIRSHMCFPEGSKLAWPIVDLHMPSGPPHVSRLILQAFVLNRTARLIHCIPCTACIVHLTDYTGRFG